METPRPDISGFLNVKRKRFWAYRYAEIQNHTFFYYKNKGKVIVNYKAIYEQERVFLYLVQRF